VLLEAASCGRAVITTDVPGCREIVYKGENGILVPPKDSVSLAKKIKELAINPERRRRMGENGRKLVKKEFSEEIIADQTFRLYLEF
jgi:glycosyltransferase involved in cell wall biosynthesis